ncbi:hypothetical protein HYDPIDRAFT_101886 [Hydnomerulius pinastri MD-312]|uniref:Unplaced genomic scaffold scaffold_74, whole genome shotgun sequence n=1 Tax=Hydnomerulius pinastri MD-312 TaxID=994086 RepID=A0A0C9W7J5_9AGAM|nr:hypothetical protein HYDPIDRAFT_101886 [Hydnomerulius pinastri MD-312]
MLSTAFRRILRFGCPPRSHIQNLFPTAITLSRRFTISSSPECNHTSKEPCTTKNSAVQDTARKVHRAQVNSLLLGADRLLATQSDDALGTYLMGKLSVNKYYNTYRAVAFTRSIRFCLERHHFNVAIGLYDRMLREGFITQSSIRLTLSALKIVEPSTKLRETVAPLKEIFAEEAYDISAFTELAHFLLNDKNASAALIDDLAQAFVSIRGVKLSDCPELVGELASVNMRAGRLDAAQKWLQIFEETCATENIQPDVTPYADIIDTLKDINPENGEAIQAILLRMKAAGVPPDIVVFNTLIRVNLVQQQYREAFALYHILMQKRSADLMPNDVTFKMLFRATQLTSNNRVTLARRPKRPANAVPPRKLFRDILECHLQETDEQALAHSTTLSVSAFHAALRTFMALEDYAAAFTLVRALHTFGFRLNLQTYLIVLTSLLHRMKRELGRVQQDGEHRLADFLTHLRPDEDPDVHTIARRIGLHQPVVERRGTSSVGIETIEHLLRLGEENRLTNDDLFDYHVTPTSQSSLQMRLRRQHAQIPTVAMLTGSEALPSHAPTYFSSAPLARILQKTLLGELFKKAMQRDPEWDWKASAVTIMRLAKEEMVPAGIKESKQMREQVEKREGVLPFAAARMRRRRRSARGGREVDLLDF